jgi:hypothetical protein
VIDFEAEAEAQKAIPVTDADVMTIAGLCQLMLDLEGEVAVAETALATVKERLRKVQEETLPNALKAAGVESFTLTDGSTVEAKADVFASITEANREAAFAWLEAHNAGAIIKEEFKLAFGKGEEDRAKAFMDLLKAGGFEDYDQKRSVHAGTLKAYVKTELEKGVDMPRDVFSIHEKSVAKVKAAKAAKKRK